MSPLPVRKHAASAANRVLLALAMGAHLFFAWHGAAVPVDPRSAMELAAQLLTGHPYALWLIGGQMLVITGLHLAVLAACYALARPATDFWTRSAVYAIGFVSFTWLSIWWILLEAHARFFPKSVWAWIIEPLTAQAASPAFGAFAAVWLLYRTGLLLHALARRATPLLRRRSVRGALALSAFLYGGHFLSGATAAHAPSTANVVIIGLDSLRRDVALDETLQDMPTLKAFRDEAFVEQNVVSPLARTFPSWTTILTGLHPAVSGARDNLVQQALVETSASIAWKFKAAGYRTIYATDETRFSNIGQTFGFDHVVSPRPGAPDFLVAQIADLPLVNFAVQLPLMEHLLPSLTGNRAFAHAYYPDRFIRRLFDAIGPAKGQPTFLAVHLCLAHWPFFSADSAAIANRDLEPNGEYLRATRELDQQFAQLLIQLRRSGYVNDQSLVVVLADHGEAPGGPQAQQPNYEFVGTDQALPWQGGGHGTSLLRADQWQTFLMFSGNSAKGAIPHGQSNDLASLEDLAPSLVALSGIELASQRRLSVVDHTFSPETPRLLRQIVAMETGFRPRGFDPTEPDGKEALIIAGRSFDVRDDGRLEMKSNIYDAMVQSKDFAVTDGVEVLAYVFTDGEPLLVHADAENNHWTIYPASHRPNHFKAAAPPLLPAACANSDMRTRLQAWCTSGETLTD